METTIQEDADAVGLSLLSGAHMTLFPRVHDLLKERGVDHVVLFGGGIIPDADVVTLKNGGIAEIFTPGAPLGDITDWLANTLDTKEKAGS